MRCCAWCRLRGPRATVRRATGCLPISTRSKAGSSAQNDGMTTRPRRTFGVRTARGLWRGFRARPRLAISVLFGAASYGLALLAHPLSSSAQVLVAWNAGAVLYLLLGWEMM